MPNYMWLDYGGSRILPISHFLHGLSDVRTMLCIL